MTLLQKIMMAIKETSLKTGGANYCKECGAPVTFENGVYIRSCQHTGTIVSSMNATVKGVCNMGVQ